LEKNPDEANFWRYLAPTQDDAQGVEFTFAAIIGGKKTSVLERSVEPILETLPNDTFADIVKLIEEADEETLTPAPISSIANDEEDIANMPTTPVKVANKKFQRKVLDEDDDEDDIFDDDDDKEFIDDTKDEGKTTEEKPSTTQVLSNSLEEKKRKGLLSYFSK
jgi:hypothetical protein